MSRILFVEDNPADQRLFRLALEASGAAADLVVANDGDRALEYFAGGGRADLVVLDWRLVRTDAGEILQKLRGSFPPGSFPIVVFSSSQSPAEMEAARNFGAPWFVKPMDADEYFSVVAKIIALSRHRAAHPQ